MYDTTSYKIGYWNCNGLSSIKMQYIQDKILDKSFDIFIVAEHWFSCQSEMEASPFFIALSSRPLKEKHTGHENGGLSLFSSIELQDQVHSIVQHEFYLSFSIGNTSFCAVYLPPRLSDSFIEETLKFLPSIDVLLGDINVRFGKDTRDVRRWNSTRGDKITRFATQRNLNQIICNSGCSRNDHVFSRLELKWDKLK